MGGFGGGGENLKMPIHSRMAIFFPRKDRFRLFTLQKIFGTVLSESLK